MNFGNFYEPTNFGMLSQDPRKIIEGGLSAFGEGWRCRTVFTAAGGTSYKECVPFPMGYGFRSKSDCEVFCQPQFKDIPFFERETIDWDDPVQVQEAIDAFELEQRNLPRPKRWKCEVHPVRGKECVRTEGVAGDGTFLTKGICQRRGDCYNGWSCEKTHDAFGETEHCVATSNGRYRDKRACEAKCPEKKV